MKRKLTESLVLLCILMGIFYSCSKGGGDDNSTPPNPCSGVNITVTSTTESATPCASSGDGKITVTASGGTGFTYSINGGTSFQASNIFNSVTAGSHSVIVKEAGGCTQSANVTVGAKPAGPLFTAVKQLIQSKCSSCHSSTNAQAGRDWTNDCNVIANKALIKTRAVDAVGTPSQMPQPPNPALSAEEQKKITDWINAGGTYAN